MIIREKWHHDEHCTIYVFFEGDGNPSHDHKIVGMRYIDNTGKTGFNAKGIGNQLFDKETFKG